MAVLNNTTEHTDLAELAYKFYAERHSAAFTDNTYTAFEQWVQNNKGFGLYPAQQEALIALSTNHNVIIATPTGTGKSMVALGAHFFALAAGRRSIYTAPIKALVSEKFFELVEIFGADQVGMVTGDFTINPEAPILCATAEILAQYCLSDKTARGITMIIMDEFHFYADRDRGWAWQVPLLTATEAQFVLMSATLGDVSATVKTLQETTGRQTAEITGMVRPVPLSFSYEVKELAEIVADTLKSKLTPAYLVYFSQQEASNAATELVKQCSVSDSQKAQLKAALSGFRFSAGYGQTLKSLLLQGVGVHHAGMLPKYRRLVEQLAREGLLNLICGTDTLGVGINVPIRTVILTSLVKYDGAKERRLTVREFQQIAGRAGRAGFDTAGDVIIAAPEHEVANRRAAEKYAAQLAKLAASSSKKPQKTPKPPKKQAPKAGVTWSETTAEKLIAAPVETLTSRMQITAAMLYTIAHREETAPGQLLSFTRKLILNSHENTAQKYVLQREAIALFKSLLAADVLRCEPVSCDPGDNAAGCADNGLGGGRDDSADVCAERGTSDSRGKIITLGQDNSAEVSLTSPLSLFGSAALELLDPASPNYAKDVISVVEATLEDPHSILRAQTNKLKNELYAELKADGVDYAERQQLAAEITYPQPLAELLAAAFEKYVAKTPWIRTQPLPKSVVRDMIENAFSFRDFINHYGLQRAEGAVLRYLTDCYRALRGVPQEKQNPEFALYLLWLGELVRQVDSSLLDEWEELNRFANSTGAVGNVTESAADSIAAVTTAALPRLTANTAAFEIMVRNAMFRLVLLFEQEKSAELAAANTMPQTIAAALGFTALSVTYWEDALDDFFDTYADINITADARNKELLKITKEGDVWELEQTLLDSEGDNAWAIYAVVDLAASDELGEVALQITACCER